MPTDDSMSGLKIVELDQADKWDTIVKSFKEYDVYWLSGYVKAFKLHGDGEPLLFYYNRNDHGKTVRGINVVMKRDIGKDLHFVELIDCDIYYDFSSPYGYGGWIIEGKDEIQIRILFETYESWCLQNGIISEFVRFHPVIKNCRQCYSAYEVMELGEVVTIDLKSPDIIWENIISKNRNMIRKAEKNNVKIYNGRYPEIYNIFHEIYNKTMDKDNAEDYYYFSSEFYNSILEDLPNNAQIFYAEKDGQIISASIFLYANKMINYHLSGFLHEYGYLAPSNLLLYKAALWGCENGYQSLYLGGGVGAKEDSLFKFKKSFYKKELNKFHVGKKIFNKVIYDKLVNMRKLDDGFTLMTSFFPLYRG